MILEELIYKRFAGSKSLTGKLATFHGMPAVFSPEPPGENQEGWDGAAQYPKVVYSFDLQANAERHSAGTLSVSLLCQNTTNIMPETIEPLVIDCLRDVVLQPEDGMPYCFAWARTDGFTIEERKGNITVGSEIRFDILEYPSQEISDPDPILAVNQYIKKLYPNSLVIGYDRMGEITEASAYTPVIYCRISNIVKSRETNTVAWMDGNIAIHILCPDGGIRTKMVADIANQMSLDGEIIMLDHSPMYVKRLRADYRSDYLKEGQIFATVQYGLLRYRAKGRGMQQAGVAGGLF